MYTVLAIGSNDAKERPNSGLIRSVLGGVKKSPADFLSVQYQLFLAVSTIYRSTDFIVI